MHPKKGSSGAPEKTMGDSRVVISESVGQRVREEELTITDFNPRNLESTNFEVNREDADLHTVTVRASPMRPADVLNQQTRDLLDSSNVIFAGVHTQQGEFGEREFDTRIKERPTTCDLDNISRTIVIISWSSIKCPQGGILSVICGLRSVCFFLLCWLFY